MRAGIVSVTFRKHSPTEIIGLMRAHQLTCVEWGGDIHVPHGNIAVAAEVAERTRDAGLFVTAYGSYYRLAASEAAGLSFHSVLDTAVALGAPTIRVWAGTRGSHEADQAHRQGVAEDALRVADLAQQAGLSICYEFHDDTLTDTTDSARTFMQATVHPAIRAIWQSPHGLSIDECLEKLDVGLTRLSHVHVFYWWPDHRHLLPLKQGEDRWMRYLRHIKAAGRSPDLLLEFMSDHDPGSLPVEAATLRSWIDALSAA